MTAEQLVARIVHGFMANSPALANTHFIIIGKHAEIRHNRVAVVPTLPAAIRLVKFGEIDSTPMPERLRAEIAPVAVNRPAEPVVNMIDTTFGFADQLISQMWNGSDAPSDLHAMSVLQDVQQAEAPIAAVMGGGAQTPATQAMPTVMSHPAKPQLFASQVAQGFTVQSALKRQLDAPTPVRGGGPAMLSQSPAALSQDGVQVASGLVSPGHAPIPPAVGAQVRTIVYGSQVVTDPLLAWSRERYQANGTGAEQVAPQPAPVQQLQFAGHAPQLPPTPMHNMQAAPVQMPHLNESSQSRR